MLQLATINPPAMQLLSSVLFTGFMLLTTSAVMAQERYCSDELEQIAGCQIGLLEEYFRASIRYQCVLGMEALIPASVMHICAENANGDLCLFFPDIRRQCTNTESCTSGCREILQEMGCCYNINSYP